MLDILTAISPIAWMQFLATGVGFSLGEFISASLALISLALLLRQSNSRSSHRLSNMRKSGQAPAPELHRSLINAEEYIDSDEDDIDYFDEISSEEDEEEGSGGGYSLTESAATGPSSQSESTTVTMDSQPLREDSSENQSHNLGVDTSIVTTREPPSIASNAPGEWL